MNFTVWPANQNRVCDTPIPGKPDGCDQPAIYVVRVCGPKDFQESERTLCRKHAEIVVGAAMEMLRTPEVQSVPHVAPKSAGRLN